MLAQLAPIPDWEKGIPLELLALVACLGGHPKMKAMRGVCKQWQQGYEQGTTGLTVSYKDSLCRGPPVPVDFYELFQGLASLHLGDSCVAEADLAQLSSLRQLQTLSLGTQSNSSALDFPLGALFTRLRGSCFRFLEGLSITDLNLRACKRVVSAELVYLRDLPLTKLDVSGCTGHLTHQEGADFLWAVPLASLDVLGLQNQSVLEIVAGMPLTSLNMSEYPFNAVRWARWYVQTLQDRSGRIFYSQFTGAGLENLRGAPLTSLKLSGCDRLGDPYLRFLSEMPLSVLDLSCCLSLTDVGVGFLRGLIDIEDLNLGGCIKLTNKSLSHLEGMPLTHLRLFRCSNITGDGLKHLLGMPLNVLDLRGCSRVVEDDVPCDLWSICLT